MAFWEVNENVFSTITGNLICLMIYFKNMKGETMNKVNEVKSLLSKIDWNFLDAKPSELNQIHPYPAKFIEQIPDILLDAFKVDKDLYVLDPFMGSGTTLVEAKRRGLNGIGIDLNPIAYLITSVKTHNLPEDFLKTLDSTVARAIQCFNRDEYKKIHISNIDHWFSRDIYRALASLITVIKDSDLDCSSKNALLLAVSSIVVKVSYQESDTRYAAKKNRYVAKDVFELFMEASKKVFKAVEDAKLPDAKVKLYCESSIDFNYQKFINKVGAVITSPPYPNAYEYWLYHKFRIEFLGYDIKQIRKQEIGTRRKYFRSKPESIQVFEQQMTNIMEMCRNVLVDKGYLAIVVGRSIIRGKEYDNAAMISEIGAKLGFVKIGDFKRSILTTKKSFNPKNSKINSENVIVFQKE